MSTLSERLEAAVSQTEADSETFHSIVNGTIGESPITTEGGPVRTVAKAIADLGDATNYASKDLGNVPPASVTVSLLASQAVTLAKLATDVLAVLQGGLDGNKYLGTWVPATDTPTVPAASGGNLGYWYFVSTAGTAVGGNAAGTYAYGDCIVSNGTVWLKRPAPPTVIPTQSVTYAMLEPTLQNALTPNSNSAVAYAIVDINNRMAFGIKTTGELIGRFIPPDESLTYAMLSEELAPALPVELSSTSGFVYAIVDINNRMAFGIRTNGDVVARFTLSTNSVATDAVIDKAITRVKLSDELNRTSTNNTQDVVAVWPDPWRFTTGQLVIRTEPSGYSWAPLPAMRSPSIRGVNGTGTALQFRRRSGLMVRGRRYAGTFNPNAAGVASIVYKGSITDVSAWPPAGAFVSGDYYTYISGTSRVIGADTLVRGDLMVYNGTAWVAQIAPVGNNELDWWDVTASGTFDGIVLVTGDRFVLLGLEATSGTAFKRWMKGDVVRGDYFVRGELDPASGLPASPANGDVWQITLAGTAGGFTFAEHDLLVRDDGVWGKVASEPVSSVASGAFVHLRNDECGWEVRRTDKSTTRVFVQLKGYRQANVRRHKDDLVVFGDSMTAFLSSAASVFLPRTITFRGYGGGTSSNIMTMAQREIVTNGDPFKGRLFIGWTGQNNSNLEAMEMALRFAELFGARDPRFVMMSVIGSRATTFNGTRLVVPDQENQFNAVAGTRYDLVSWYNTTFPENHFNTRAQLCAVAPATADLQFPGMTEAQSAATYGVVPLSWFINYTALGITPGNLVFQGYRSSAGLPTGGANNDYWLRSANGTVGAIIVNAAGVWTEYTFDTIHLFTANGSPGNVALATALLGFINTKGW